MMRLAASLGCCALFSSNAGDEELLDSAPRPKYNGGVCYDEPRPMTSHSMNYHLSRRTPHAQGASSRTMGSLRSNVTRKPSSTRPVISAPTDFRRVDGADGLPHPETLPELPEAMATPDTISEHSVLQIPTPVRRRRSFRPLELSIYLPDNQLSPLPNFDRQSWHKKLSLSGLSIPSRARVRDGRRDSASSTWSGFSIRRKPIQSQRASIVTVSTVNVSPKIPEEDPSSSDRPVLDRSTTLPHMPARRSSLFTVSNVNDSDQYPVPSLPERPSTANALSAKEFAKPTKQQQTHRHTQRSESVDSEIRELDAIVSGRRTTAAARNAAAIRPNNSSSPALHHVPALAPNLRMHVRSQTLSDIGSAFSAPFVTSTKPLPSIPSSPLQEDHGADAAVRVDDFPAPPAARNGSASTSASRSRLATWIRKSMPASPPPAEPSNKTTIPATPTPFYACAADAGSVGSPASLSSSLSSSLASLSEALTGEGEGLLGIQAQVPEVMGGKVARAGVVDVGAKGAGRKGSAVGAAY